VIAALSNLMELSPIYRPPEPHLEARSRLLGLLSVCEHELAAMEALGDVRLARIIEHMRSFHEELQTALAAFAQESAPCLIPRANPLLQT
jgi:hypothetical protein